MRLCYVGASQENPVIQYRTIQMERKHGGWLAAVGWGKGGWPTNAKLAATSFAVGEAARLSASQLYPRHWTEEPVYVIVARAWGGCNWPDNSKHRYAGSLYPWGNESETQAAQWRWADQTVFNSVKNQRSVFNTVSLFKERTMRVEGRVLNRKRVGNHVEELYAKLVACSPKVSCNERFF